MQAYATYLIDLYLLPVDRGGRIWLEPSRFDGKYSPSATTANVLASTLASTRISRLATHAYVVTIVWATMCITLGFIETPLRFSAPIPRSAALEVGHRVFHTLNYCEIFFAAITTIAVLAGNQRRITAIILGIPVVILLGQTWLLFFVLDARTMSVIAGESVPPAPYHTIYIVLELIKLFFLIVLSTMLIRSASKTNLDTGA